MIGPTKEIYFILFEHVFINFFVLLTLHLLHMSIFYLTLIELVVVSRPFFKKSIKSVLQFMKDNGCYSFFGLSWTIIKFVSKKISTILIEASTMVI